MLENPQSYLFLLLISCGFFWSCPPKWIKARIWILIGFSVFFILSIAPYGACIALLITFYFWILAYFKDKIQKWHTWAGVIPLLLVFSYVRFFQESELGLLITLGMTFTILRGYALLESSKKSKKKMSLRDSLLYMLFFPTYSAGPIERVKTFSVQNFTENSTFKPKLFLEGAIRIMLGLFKIQFLANEIVASWLGTIGQGVFSDEYYNGPLYVIIFSILSLLKVYLQFSGFSDIAIGASNMLGIKILENFNLPFLATNMIEFWQRWHMSLGQWIKSYLYMPLIRNYGRIYWSIFMAFLIIGLWHEYSVNYFVWGLGHGAALAITQKFKRYSSSKKTAQAETNLFNKMTQVASINFSRLMTIVYASILSVFANCGSVENGLNYLKNLFTVYF